jgi:hypothetical protein
MKLLFFLIAGGLVCFIVLMIWVDKYVYHDPEEDTNYTYPDPFCEHDKLHGDPEIDEHDPRNLDLDKMLKVINLRNKLKKIESEKNDVDLNYQNKSGL